MGYSIIPSVAISPVSFVHWSFFLLVLMGLWGLLATRLWIVGLSNLLSSWYCQFKANCPTFYYQVSRFSAWVKISTLALLPDLSRHQFMCLTLPYSIYLNECFQFTMILRAYAILLSRQSWSSGDEFLNFYSDHRFITQFWLLGNKFHGKYNR